MRFSKAKKVISAMRLKTYIVFAILTLLSPSNALAGPPVVLFPSSPGPRTVTNFDFDWKFKLGDLAAASAEAFDDSAWRTLDVPHDW